MARLLALHIHGMPTTPLYINVAAIDALVQRDGFTEVYPRSGDHFAVTETAEYILALIPSNAKEIRQQIDLENLYKER